MLEYVQNKISILRFVSDLSQPYTLWLLLWIRYLLDAVISSDFETEYYVYSLVNVRVFCGIGMIIPDYDYLMDLSFVSDYELMIDFVN